MTARLGDLGPRAALARTGSWFRELVWEEEDPAWWGQLLRLLTITWWKFRAVDRGFLRASALTYTTLLSLVPLLALMFAVLTGLGVQRRLEPLLLDHLAMGNEEVVHQIIQYVDRTKIGALGALGLVTLLLTAVSVLSNIELSFNDIWQVQRGRHVFRKVADYIAMLVVGPILLLASISAGAMLQTSAASETLALLGPVLNLLLRSAPYVSIWVALTLVYLLMPNRRVPFSAAVLGAVSAGTLWKIAEGLYIYFQFGMARYNAIYGAMAQLPMLLVWVYVSWCIVLLGAELAFIFQLPEKGRLLRSRTGLWVPRLDVALPMLLEVGRRFETGQQAATLAQLGELTGLHVGQAEGVVSRLVDEGLLLWTQDDPMRLVPARAPDTTSVAELVEHLQRVSKEGEEKHALTMEIVSAIDDQYSELTWADLARRESPRGESR